MAMSKLCQAPALAPTIFATSPMSPKPGVESGDWRDNETRGSKIARSHGMQLQLLSGCYVNAPKTQHAKLQVGFAGKPAQCVEHTRHITFHISSIVIFWHCLNMKVIVLQVVAIVTITNFWRVTASWDDEDEYDEDESESEDVFGDSEDDFDHDILDKNKEWDLSAAHNVTTNADNQVL